MRINIKNYKTLKNVNFSYKKNEINYVIGSNESGKTNLFDALRVISKNDAIKVDKSSATVTKNIYSKVESIEFHIFSEDNSFKNKIDYAREQFWIDKDFGYYDEYLSLVKQEMPSLELIKNKFANLIANNAIQPPSYYPQLEFLKSLYQQIHTLDSNLMTLDLLDVSQIRFLIEIKEKPELTQHLEASWLESLEKIADYYKKIELKRPYVIFVQPMANAFKKEKIVYQWTELDKSDSLLIKMIKSFGQQEVLDNLNEIFKNKGQENNTKRLKNNLISGLNKQIANYFDEFLPILKGHPKLIIEGSEIVLDIEPNSSFKYEIDDGDEDTRSLGFKSFVRIALEIKMLSKGNEDVIYIIDEPEQGLHPFLQELLMSELKKTVENADNRVTIIIASHSPYIVQFGSEDYDKYFKNLSFVIRNQFAKDSFVPGETLIKTIDEKDYFDEMLQKWASSVHRPGSAKMDEEVFLFRMVMDSKNLSDFDRAVKRKIAHLHRDLNTNKITPEDFQKLVKEVCLIKDQIK